MQTEFTYNKSSMFCRSKEGNGFEFKDPVDDIDIDQDMFTEHKLDSIDNEVLKNSETRSIILAPFNSTKSNLGPDGNPIDEELSDSIKDLIVDRRIVKFGPRVRDIDK